MEQKPKRPRGRPPKKKTLEQEAQEFLKKEPKQEIPPGQVPLGDYYAGCALSGLIASGRYLRSDEIIDEAFKYSERMLDKKNK